MWAAYYDIDPWGERRADLRSGIIASTLANINRKKSSSAYKPEDFAPKFERRKKKESSPPGDPKVQTWQEQKAAMMALATSSNKAKG